MIVSFFEKLKYFHVVELVDLISKVRAWISGLRSSFLHPINKPVKTRSIDKFIFIVIVNLITQK